MTNAMTQIRQALAALLDEVDRTTCRHERTYRIRGKWTICRDCSMAWADNAGGFVPYADSPAVAQARAALAEPEVTEPTPEMVEAGAAVLCGFETVTTNESYWAKLVYLAMEAARATARPLPEREATLLRDYGE